VAGALLAGITADLFGLTSALQVVAALTFLSGLLAAVRLHETLPRLIAPASTVRASSSGAR
jgi:hypothetical protein